MADSTAHDQRDREVALVMAEVFRELPGPPAVILVNNRKLMEGFFRGVGATDLGAAMRAIDKLGKAGPVAVAGLLVSEAGMSAGAADQCLTLAAIRSADGSFVPRVGELGVEHALLAEGLAELAAVINERPEERQTRRAAGRSDRSAPAVCGTGSPNGTRG